MAEKITVDCSTGERRTEPLTAEEADARAAAAAEREAESTAEKDREQRRQAAVDQLRVIANASSFTATQRDNAIKFTAKVLAAVLPFIDLDPDS